TAIFLHSKVGGNGQKSKGDLVMSETRKKVGFGDSLLQFFAYEPLPHELQEVSRPFAVLARVVAETLPRNPERTTALRKLMEAMDCAVRARLYIDPTQSPQTN